MSEFQWGGDREREAGRQHAKAGVETCKLHLLLRCNKKAGDSTLKLAQERVNYIYVPRGPVKRGRRERGDMYTKISTETCKLHLRPRASEGGGDSSVVRANGLVIERSRVSNPLLERRENFILQGRLSVLTLISVSVPPPCYHSST